MKKKEKINMPLWYKYALTISEASVYFGIGEKKLRQVVMENDTAEFILRNGSKVLIKREKFQEYLDDIQCI
jgi:excisionase family DNA binding protein